MKKYILAMIMVLVMVGSVWGFGFGGISTSSGFSTSKDRDITGDWTFDSLIIDGTDNSVAGINGLKIERNLTGNALNQDNIRDLTTLNPSGGTAHMFDSYDTSIVAYGAFDYDHLAGYQDRINFSGSGTLTSQWGFYSQPWFNGTVTNRYAVKVLDPFGEGVLTNNYGVHIAALTRGTNNWAVYTVAPTKSYFGGMVCIGTETANSKLNIISDNPGVPVFTAALTGTGAKHCEYLSL